jgi:hypothetical protein
MAARAGKEGKRGHRATPLDGGYSGSLGIELAPSIEHNCNRTSSSNDPSNSLLPYWTRHDLTLNIFKSSFSSFHNLHSSIICFGREPSIAASSRPQQEELFCYHTTARSRRERPASAHKKHIGNAYKNIAHPCSGDIRLISYIEDYTGKHDVCCAQGHASPS